MTGVVLDASALLAMMRDEPGAARVAMALDGALISTVNWAEVAGHYTQRGVSLKSTRARMATLPVLIVPATADHALEAAALLPATRSAGLSLGDRFCLALARGEQRRALTADRAWSMLSLDGIEIELIR